MKLKDIAHRIWRSAEAFADALDYDPYADIMLRVEQLELDSQSRQARLTALSDEVLKLSGQVRQGLRPTL